MIVQFPEGHQSNRTICRTEQLLQERADRTKRSAYTICWMSVMLSPFNMILPKESVRLVDRTERRSRTQFPSWFCLLDVDLGGIVNHDVHKLVETL